MQTTSCARPSGTTTLSFLKDKILQSLKFKNGRNRIMVRYIWHVCETLRNSPETWALGEAGVIDVVNGQACGRRKIHELVPYRSMFQRLAESIERRDAVGYLRCGAGARHDPVKVIQNGICRTCAFQAAPRLRYGDMLHPIRKKVSQASLTARMCPNP